MTGALLSLKPLACSGAGIGAQNPFILHILLDLGQGGHPDGCWGRCCVAKARYGMNTPFWGVGDPF